MEKLSIYLAKSRSNYLKSREEKLDLEILSETRLDYFRMLLLKKTSFNSNDFKKWCDTNNYLDLYDLALNDINYLHSKKILIKENDVYKFKSESAYNKLLNFQINYIDRNEQRIDLLSDVKDDEYFTKLTIDLQNEFTQTVLSSKDEIKKYMNFVSQNLNNTFGNTIVMFLQLKEKSLNFSMLREHSFWLNQKINGKNIEIKNIDNDLKVLKPITKNNKTIAYSIKKLYDISQTNISLNDLEYKKELDYDLIKIKLEHSINNSKIFSKIFKNDSRNNELIGKEIIKYYCSKISNYYFFDEEEKVLFNYLMNKALNIDIELDNISLYNIKNKLSNVISTYNIVSTELMLYDIVHENKLEDLFYFKLGTKNDLIDVNSINSSNDRQNFLIGNIKLNDLNFTNSIHLAREILDNEEIKININYENLFVSAKTLTILSGEYKNESFSLDSDYSDDEVKLIVARDYLSKLVEKTLLKNSIKIGVENEFKRNSELFSGEHKNDIGQLHVEIQTRNLQEDGTEFDSSSISNANSRNSDGPNEQFNRRGLQRERSLGDSKQGTNLSKIDKIPAIYIDYFNTATFSTFKHTKTDELLNVMKLNTRLNKSDYKYFNNYLSKNGIGYYSKIAKAFIINDLDILNHFLQNKNIANTKQSEILISDLGFKINETTLSNNKTITYIGKNIFDKDVYEDENKVREYTENEGKIFISEKISLIPGKKLIVSDEETKFIEGKFDFLIKSEIIKFSKDETLINKIENDNYLNILEELGYLKSKFSKRADELELNEYNSFLQENYPFMNNLDKNKYQDIIDSRLQVRAETLANHFGFNEPNEWLRYANFEKSNSDTNVIGMTVFGVVDLFKEINEYANEIMQSQEYKNWFEKENKNKKFQVNNEIISLDLIKNEQKYWLRDYGDEIGYTELIFNYKESPVSGENKSFEIAFVNKEGDITFCENNDYFIINDEKEKGLELFKKIRNNLPESTIKKLEEKSRKNSLFEIEQLNSLFLRKYNLEIVGVSLETLRIWNFVEQKDLKSFNTYKELSTYVRNEDFVELLTDKKELKSIIENGYILYAQYSGNDSVNPLIAQRYGFNLYTGRVSIMRQATSMYDNKTENPLTEGLLERLGTLNFDRLKQSFDSVLEDTGIKEQYKIVSKESFDKLYSDWFDKEYSKFHNEDFDEEINLNNLYMFDEQTQLDYLTKELFNAQNELISDDRKISMLKNAINSLNKQDSNIERRTIWSRYGYDFSYTDIDNRAYVYKNGEFIESKLLNDKYTVDHFEYDFLKKVITSYKGISINESEESYWTPDGMISDNADIQKNFNNEKNLHFINLEYETGLEWDDITSYIPTLTIDNGVHNNGNITKVSLTLNNNKTIDLFYDEISNEYTYENEDNVYVEILNKIGYLLQNKIDLELLSDKILNNKIDILDEININEIINEYVDVIFENDTYRIYPDTSIAEIHDDKIVDVLIDYSLAKRILDAARIENKIKYSELTNLPIGLTQANYTERVKSFEKQKSDIENGNLPVNEHLFKSLYDKLQCILDYEEKNNIISKRSLNEINKFNNNKESHSKISERESNQLRTETNRDIVSTEFSNLSSSNQIRNSERGSDFSNGNIINERNENLTREWKFELNNNELKVLNLKDFYSVNEIENLFIKKQVTWEIFANKYIFDLTNEVHLDLVKNELNLQIPALRLSKDLFIEYKNSIKETTNKKDLTDVYYKIKKDLTDRDLTENEFSNLHKLIDERFLELDVEIKNLHYKSICELRSQGNNHYKQLLDDYNLKYHENLLEKDIQIDNDTFEKYKQISFKTLIGVYNRNEEIDEEIIKHNELFNDQITIDDLEEDFSIEDSTKRNGTKTKFKNYIAGIEIIRKIERNEEISIDDKIVLSQMPGIGAIAQAFPRTNGTVAKGWEKEAEELKTILTDNEYKQAARATLDAYYTDEFICKAMWKAIENFGYSGGSVLEPAMGTGNFFGYMPKHLKPNSQLIGIELDKTTAKVAQILYPKAKIYNIGFQNFTLLEGQKASIVIGNPPYGSHKIYDNQYKELNGMAIHNYFMGKSIECLEDGGVMAMVVSNNFLDSNDPSARAFIGKTANLIGAIRLPKGSFGNANTEIVTDIVFFQKREYGMESNISDWLNIGEINDTPINEYFVKNENQLLGEWGKYGTMYRGDEPALIERPGQNTKELLTNAIENLPRYINYDSGKKSYSKIATKDSSVSSAQKILEYKTNFLAKTLAQQNGEKMTSDARINSLFINDDKIYKRYPDLNGEIYIEEITTKINSKDEEKELTELEIEKIKGMIKIAEIANKLRYSQLDEDISDFELDLIRKDLNEVYDKFVKKYGFLNKGSNANLFEEDVNAPLLLALEKKYDKGISSTVAKKFGVKPMKETAVKADIFFKRTQTPYKIPTSAETYEDALHISLAEKTYVDMNYMSSLLNKDIKDIENYLSSNDFIFNDPNYGWVTREEYLSGNVKEKYKETNNPKNLDALEKVIPEDIPAIDISVACGASWIPKKDINDFVSEISGDNTANVFYINYTASWSIGDLSVSSDKENIYGTGRRSAKDIILAALNNKQVTVYDKVGEGEQARNVLNQDETTAANDKVDLVKEAWSEWIWNTSDRRERLAKLYNDKFNVYAKREYDGKHLKFPGKVDDTTIELRPHQKNAVWRVLQNGRDLFDHTVGSGKTFSAIASVMELKRTGKSKKPLIVVPNHLVSQWAKEWLELYPNANLLVPSKKDFTAKKRKLLMSRIATGEYDGIIIAHSQLIKIQNDKNFEIKFFEEQIEQIHDAINQMRDEKGKDGLSIKQWENKKDALNSKMERLLNSPKDDNLNFSELGIDAMIVDEAHEFKNLQFHTSLQRIRGLGNPQGSQKAFDMYIKSQCLLEKTNNKNLIFLTGTPISNSIAEMYTLKRYLMSDELKKDGLEHFDAWAKQYAEIKTDWELTASGKYKLITRMSKFKNMPELIASYRTFADVITTQMVKDQLALEGKVLDIPDVRDGKPKNVIVERSEDQANFIGVPDENGIYKSGTLVYRSENMPKGKPKKGDDNMLVVMSDAKKASLDMRLIDPNYPDFEGSKVNKCIDDLIENYHKWDIFKGTQLIFCDLSTPKGAVASERIKLEELLIKAESGDEDAAKELDSFSPDEIDSILNSTFSVYDDVKEKLIQRGIPENEIAFIHDAKTDLQKQELFLKVNSGHIRFLMGSTSKMGAGTNVQKKLVHEGHLDVPWRPSDLEQREGRIIRQGNSIFKLFKAIRENNYDINKIKKNAKDLLDEFDLINRLDELIEFVKNEESQFYVTIYRYATKNTLDSGLWEKIEAKARFIQQLKNGDVLDREVEDISGEEANAAEMKAASSGNPLILEEMQLKTEIKKIEAVKKNFKRSLHDREERIKSYERTLGNFEETENQYLKDIEKYDNYKVKMETKKLNYEKQKLENKNKGISNKDLETVTDFEFVINGKIYDKREEVGAYIITKARDLQYETKINVKTIDVGTIGDFTVFIEKANLFRDHLMTLVIKGEKEYTIDFDAREQKAIGIAVKMINELDRIKGNYEQFINYNSTIVKELPKLKALPTEFPKEDELQLLKRRYKAVVGELQAKDSKQNVSIENREEEDNNSTKNTWVDENKEFSTVILLSKGNFDLSILEKIDYTFVGNCLVLNNELDRKDYLKFQKIFEAFGGIWDRKKSGIIFSDDGIKRMKETLDSKDVYNNTNELRSLIKNSDKELEL